MKNSILYRIYMKRLIPVIVLIGALLFIFMTDEIIFYRNGETALMIVMVAMTGGIMLYLMRRPTEHNFVNSLPVTKEQQWQSMYYALLTTAASVYVAYIIITYIQCHNDVITFKEVLVSGVVKCATAVFAMTLVLWILGHTDFSVSGKFIITLIMFFGGIGAVGTAVQKAFNTGTNNFIYELKKYWCLMTVPVQHFENTRLEFGMGGFPQVTADEKIIVTAIYLAVITALTVVLAGRSKICYARIPFSKNMNKGFAARFPKILTAVYLSVCFMGMLCRVVELKDYVTTETSNDPGISYIQYDPEDTIRNAGGEEIIVYKNGEVYYKGIVYQNYEQNYLYKYEIYKIDFPKEYLYIFIANAAISVTAGTVTSVIADKTLRKRGVI